MALSWTGKTPDWGPNPTSGATVATTHVLNVYSGSRWNDTGTFANDDQANCSDAPYSSPHTTVWTITVKFLLNVWEAGTGVTPVKGAQVVNNVLVETTNGYTLSGGWLAGHWYIWSCKTWVTAGHCAHDTGQVDTQGNPIWHFHDEVTTASATGTWSKPWPFPEPGNQVTSPEFSFFVQCPPAPPLTPTLQSPANASTGISTSPTLVWTGGSSVAPPCSQPVTYVVSYRKRGTTNTWTTVSASASTTVGISGLAGNTEYEWYVTATSGTESRVSTTWWFKTKNSPPNKPVYIAPICGSVDVPFTPRPTLVWSCTDPEGDPLQFQVFFWKDGDTKPTVPTATTTSTSWPIPTSITLASKQKYWWSICAIDTTDNSKTCADYDCGFTMEDTNKPPTVPVYVNPSPTDGSKCHTTVKKTLSFTSSDPDGNSLQFQVLFGTSTPPPVVLAWSTMATSPKSWDTPTLVSGTTYYWQIQVMDLPPSPSVSKVVSGPIWSFRTEGSPLIPSNPSPYDGANSVSLPVVLSWVGGSPDGCPGISYTVVMDADNANPTTIVASNLATSTFTPSNVVHGKWYYWKIRSTNAQGVVVEGPVWRFLCNRAPLTPFNPNPVDGKNDCTVSLDKLTWDCSDPDGDLVTYDVYFGVCPNTPLMATGISSKEFTIPTGVLQWSNQYCWYVVAHDPWVAVQGPLWKFVCDRPPTAPRNPYPYDGQYGVLPNVIMRWECSDPDEPWGDVLSYDIYIAIDATGTGTNFGTPIYAGTSSTPTFDPVDLPEGAMILWRVVAKDKWGLQTSGPNWRFKVNRSPNPPRNPTPTDDYRQCLPIVMFTWECEDPDGDAVEYDIYIDALTPTTIPPQALLKPSGVSRLVASGVKVATFTTEPGFLLRSTRHFWRVLARDSNGGTTWGPIWTFVVNYPPNLPFKPKPADGARRVHPTTTVSCKGSDPDL